MEEKRIQTSCKTRSQDVKEVIVMSIAKILADILAQLKLLRKDLKK